MAIATLVQEVEEVETVTFTPKYPTFNSAVYAFGNNDVSFDDMDSEPARAGWTACIMALSDGSDPMDQGAGIEGDYEWIRGGC